MAKRSPTVGPSETTSRRLPEESPAYQPEEGAAALPHVRQRRRRQEHAHRPAAARHQDDLRGPARRREARQREGRHHRRGEIDLALLTDGLKAEREQGITIDVAYRYFSTDRRKFIIADTPGHEQYTRNMATGASTCQLAIILIDARHGVMTQTRRHTFIVSLLGIRHVVVAVNKMDLVGYSQEVFERIKDDYTGFVAKLDLRDITFIPMSALKGDNVVSRSDAMPWYSGPPLLDHLETVHIASDRNLTDLRFPVQYVLRPNLDFRGFAGTVASGILRKGDEVMVAAVGQAQPGEVDRDLRRRAGRGVRAAWR